MPATAKRSRSRAQTRKRYPQRRALLQDRPRQADELTGLRIDGKSVDFRIGDRLTGAKLSRVIDGANTLSLDLWDGDHAVAASGVLGARVMSRVAEVSLDGLDYTVTGDSRDGDVLTLTLEDALITYLKRHGRQSPRRSSRGTTTRAGFCAGLLRDAGVAVIVLDEHTIQAKKGVKKLRAELAKAKDQAKADRTGRRPRSRAQTVGAGELVGLKVNG